MAIQGTDVLLVNRAGTDYQTPSSSVMTKVQSTDWVLCNRGGVDYKISGANFLAGTFQDTDWFLINRAGVDYKVDGKTMKSILSRAPVIGTVVLSEEDTAGAAFTSQKFKTTITLTDAGQPAATVGLKAYVEGTLTASAMTSAITKVDQNVPTGWTIHPSSNDAMIWASVCWSPARKLFVAVARGGAGNRVMTSPDGTTWTSQPSANDSNSWQRVIWSPKRSLFVAVANSGSQRVMTSPDGINWTGRTSADETNAWIGLCWSPERSLFVATSETGINRVMTSPDGITWTGHTAAPDGNKWSSVCWAAGLGLFVAVGAGGGNLVMTSPDGTNWTARASANESAPWRDICWSPEEARLVAVASDGVNQIMTSEDGIKWTSHVTPSPNNGWYSICWAPERALYVVVAQAGAKKIMSSPDGKTWAEQTGSADANEWRAVTWSPDLGLFVAVAQSGPSGKTVSSKDAGISTTSLTFVDNAGLAEFIVGDAITEQTSAGGVGDAIGFVVSSTPASNQMVVTSNAKWDVGSKVKGPAKAQPGARLYLKFDAAGTVTDMQSADPGFVAMTNTTAPVLTFPATFPSGNAPDVELPNGTTITTVVEAKNTTGTVTKTSNTVTPAR